MWLPVSLVLGDVISGVGGAVVLDVLVLLPVAYSGVVLLYSGCIMSCYLFGIYRVCLM